MTMKREANKNLHENVRPRFESARDLSDCYRCIEQVVDATEN